MPKVKARADAVSASSRDGVETVAARHERLHRLQGTRAIRIAATRSRVDEERADARRASSSTSAAARSVPDMPGVDDVPFLTNTLDPGARLGAASI